MAMWSYGSYTCRESSTPNCLTIYSGKYEVPETMPDGLHMQKIMAGQAERKAEDCVIECTAAGLKEGRFVSAALVYVMLHMRCP